MDELIELIEHSGEVAKYFVEAEIALGDGNLADSQKSTRMAVQLFKAMKKDSLAETSEFLGVGGESVDYDYPNNMELVKQLCCLSSAAASLCAAQNEEAKVLDLLKKKVANHIITAIEIFDALYEN